MKTWGIGRHHRGLTVNPTTPDKLSTVYMYEFLNCERNRLYMTFKGQCQHLKCLKSNIYKTVLDNEKL